MSAPDRTTATLDRELRAIDHALASGTASSAEPAERELQELALALRADVPEPEPDFASRLDARRRAGFPPAASSVRGRARAAGRRLGMLLPARRPPLRRALPVAGVALSLLVAAVVVVSSRDGGDERLAVQDRGPSGGSEEPRMGADEAAPSVERAAPNSVLPPSPPPPGGGDFSPGARERRIERSAALTLAAPADRLDRVADGVLEITDRHRGFVLRSSVTSGDEGTTGGSFELRIPADRLREALRDLSGLGKVRSRTQSGQDVTRPFVSARDRLETARAERRSLLRRLENANTDEEAEAIRRRLDQVAGQIRGLRGQLRDLRLRTDFAAVSVTLVEDESDGSSNGGGFGDTGDALDDALGSLAGALGLALRVLGVLVPLALLGGVAWLAGSFLRRRRRESALA